MLNTKIALAHHWLERFTGGEKVVEEIASLYPYAPIYTLIYQPENFQGTRISQRQVYTSFIQRLPWGRTKYRTYLPLMPAAIEQFDLGEYDVILSSCSFVAKGVLTRADQLHISYIHTPVRYAWDLYHDYLRESRLDRGVKGVMARAVLHYIRMWDLQAANRVDVFLANSYNVAERIRKTYRREAQVIYPPVDVDRFNPERPRDDFYFTVSRLVPYKRIDLIVAAFNRLGLPLVVIGDGPERSKIEALAGPNVRLLGHQPDAVVTDHMERCKAFIFAADEDFGIVPVEAQAAGAPVVAFGRGGALETVLHGRTGIHYPEQTEASLVEAVKIIENKSASFQAETIRNNAARFSSARFRQEYGMLVEREWETFMQRRNSLYAAHAVSE